MPSRRVEIDLNAPTGSGRIKVDGQVIRGVQAFRIDSSALTRRTTVELDLYVDPLVFTADADVTLPERVVESLLALGWTPPSTPDGTIPLPADCEPDSI